MSLIPSLVSDSLQRIGCKNLQTYLNFLTQACKVHPPEYGMAWYGESYRKLACDSTWFASSLVVNAEKEGYGSQRIWQFANRIADTEIAQLVRSHSMDESRHSKMFIVLLNNIFPNLLDKSLYSELTNLSPGYTKRSQPEILPILPENQLSELRVIDELIQVNFVEIRSLVLQLLLRPVVLAHSQTHNKTKIVGILDSLLIDEVRHIEYSAACIEKAATKGHLDFVHETMICRQSDLNELTLQEVELENYN